VVCGVCVVCLMVRGCVCAVEVFVSVVKN